MNNKIVDTAKTIDYTLLCSYIKHIKNAYPCTELKSAGRSLLGKELWVISVGDGSKNIFCNGAHHGSEWITALVLIAFAEELAYNMCMQTTRWFSLDISRLFAKCTFHILPMVNPDGVDLSVNSINAEHLLYDRLMSMNKNSLDFTHWNANARGVDLNHNYPAGWINAKTMESAYGIHGPGPTRYGGECSKSEPETCAMTELTRSICPNITVSFHSQGEEIYCDYGKKTPRISRYISQKFADLTSYKISKPDGIASYAGYKDWFIEEFEKPGFTIELGKGENPLPISEFASCYNAAAKIMIASGLLC